MTAVPPLPARPEPALRLASAARGQWTLQALGWALPLVIGVSLALGGIDGVPRGLAGLALAATVLGAVVGVVVVPQLRWRRWRWDVRDEEIDLRHGALTEIRTIIPMARVQHVDVRRSFLQQQSDTANLVIHTAAGASTIPMLHQADAVAVRDRIVDLARTPDEL